MEGTSGESPSNFLFLDILPVVQNADKSATKKIRGLLGIFVLVQSFLLENVFLLERFTIVSITHNNKHNLVEAAHTFLKKEKSPKGMGSRFGFSKRSGSQKVSTRHFKKKLKSLPGDFSIIEKTKPQS